MKRMAMELAGLAKAVMAGDVGEKVEFVADSFQMPFDVPGGREYKYKGVVQAQRSGVLTVKLSSPSWAAGKVVKVPEREETLRIG